MIQPRLIILSLLGGRSAVANRHITACAASLLNSDDCRFVFYVTHPTNDRLYRTACKEAERMLNADVILKDFQQSTYPSGFDHDYDILLSRYVCNESKFLCLHDDTILGSHVCLQDILDLLSDVRLAGYRDHNVDLADYQDILIDGRPLGDIRLGTWFLCGKTPLPTDIGCGRFFRRDQIEALGSPGRIVVKKPLVWMNGGCLLNIQARLQGMACRIIDRNSYRYATHVEAGTWDLVKTGLLRFDMFDHNDEAKLILAAFSQQTPDERKHCLASLQRIVTRYEESEIHDPVISYDLICELQSMGNTKRTSGFRRHVAHSYCLPRSGWCNELPLPSRIHIETVDDNKTCYSSHNSFKISPPTSPVREMSMDLFRELVSSLEDMNVIQVTIGLWNNPLLDSQLRERLIILADRLPSAEIRLAVKLHNASPETFNILSNVPFNTLQLYLADHFFATRSTLVHPISIVEYLHNIREVLRPYSYHFRMQLIAQYEDKIHPNGFYENWESLDFDYIDAGDSSTDSAFLLRSSKRCHMYVYGCNLGRHIDWLHIGVSGDIWLCPNDINRECFLGSLADQSMDNLLSGNSRMTYRYRIETGGPDRLPCHFCPYAISEEAF